MVLNKSRWQWHQCLQTKQTNQRSLPYDTDSESDNEECHFQTPNSQLSLNDPSESDRQTKENLFILQQKLKEEVKLAFASSAKMAKTQVELERAIQETKHASWYKEIGIKNYDQRPLTISVLDCLNIGQLQTIFHDLHYQVDASNEELVNCLIERDSLSMEQDSILVDIEDLTRRIQERIAWKSKSTDRTSVYSCLFNHSSSNSSFIQSFLRKAAFI